MVVRAASRAMHQRLRAAGFVLAVVLASATAAGPAHAAPLPPLGYVAIPLTPTTGRTFEASPSGNPINSSAQVAGWTEVVTDYVPAHAAAVFHLADRTVRVLHPPGSTSSVAWDINNLGQVTGSAWYPVRLDQAFVWTPSTNTYRVLDTPGGGRSTPTAINDHGVVVGGFVTSDHRDRAFVSDPAVDGGRMRDLGALVKDDDYVRATGINNSGDVVGISSSGSTRAARTFLWRPSTGAMTDLGQPSGTNQTRPNDINDAGYIVGASSDTPRTDPDPYVRTHAWVWSPFTHKFRMLPAAYGGDSDAKAINRHGIIVGTSSVVTQEAMLWNACGTAKQVLSSNRGFTYASGINRYERVVGSDASIPVIWRRNNGPCRT